MKVNLIDGKLLLQPEYHKDIGILERLLNIENSVVCGYGRDAKYGQLLHVELKVTTNKGDTT